MPAHWFPALALLPGRWRLGRQWYRLSVLILGLLPLVAEAQFQPQSTKEQLAFRFVRPGQRKVRIPFEFQRNLIIVQAHLNGQGPYNFLLDSGVGISLITDPTLIEPLKLRRGANYNVMGAGQEKPLEAFFSDSVQVKMPGVIAPTLPFLVLSADVLNLSGYVGIPIHGILGYDVFNSFVVQVEPTAAQLWFHAPNSFEAPKGRRWTKMLLDIEGRKSYLNTAVSITDSLTLPLKLVLDTGAGHALSLETSSDKRMRVPTERLRAQLGRGLSGAINGYLGRVRSMQLGRYKLNSPLTSFPDADNGAMRVEVPRNGNIGFELLKRFEVIIDYTHNSLWLRPNALFRDPFEHDMCGLELLASGPEYRRYFVLRLEPNSPAAAAGLQPDDELVSINLIPVKSMSLTQISRIFHSGDGKTLFLIIERNGQSVAAFVRLKRQI
ncbi:aspartyl protease family protein [Hymenobacter sp.]|jgi:membrane-associated protease RseP (regulator of RpoE activity)|uniref:aspartyl protease family protein n=1 Tax=Hymenobacter sp. TaxID=1898978 RepID=UPI002ED82183